MRRRRLGVLRTAPWRRAPLAAWRRPGVLAAVAGSAAVASAAVAGVPLFVSAAGSESIVVQAEERCPPDTGVMVPDAFAVPGVAGGPDGLAPLPTGGLPAAPSALLGDDLGEPTLWLTQEGVRLAPVGAEGPGDDIEVTAISREGQLDHVELVEGAAGPGLFVSDRVTRATGLRAGDRVTVGATSRLDAGAPPGAGPAELPIAGVFRDFSGVVREDEWCAHSDLLLPEGDLFELPPPIVLVDRATLAEVFAASGVATAVGGWDVPLARDGLTLQRAEALVGRLGCGDAVAARLAWCANVSHDGEEVLVEYEVTQPVRGGGVVTEPQVDRYPDGDEFVRHVLSSSLPFVTDRTRAIQTSVAGGVVPVAGFAALAGLGLVGAAASLWADRRRREVALLTVRGVSPAAIGAKAVLELAAGLVAGAAAGFGAAYGLVAWRGPSATFEASAVVRAAVAAVVAAVAGAAVVGAVVAVRARGHHAAPGRWRWAAAVPWELACVVAAVVAYRRLGRFGVPVGDGAEASSVDAVGLTFPVLFLLAAVAVLARLVALGLRPLRAASRRWPTAAFLAVRRVARHRATTVGLVAASALTAGVLGYAATLTASLDATLVAKARGFVGSDAAVRLEREAEVPAGLADRATEVLTFRAAWADTGGGRDGVVVLGIDPATFARATHWEPGFADVPLAEVLDRLAAGPGEDGAVPAVAVGMPVPAGTEVGIIGGRSTRIVVAEVADVRAFPGMRRATPTIVVDAASLADRAGRGGSRELWVRGDRDDTLAALEAARLGATEVRVVGEVADRASFLTVSWAFGFMRALGVAAGALVVGAVAVVLDARRRSRALGYAFARRMGLARGTHRWSTFGELVATVVVGCWAGAGIALAGARLAHGRIDPVPDFRPGPLLRPAVAATAAILVAAVALAAAGAVVAQRRADRDDPVEVLRAGT